MKLLILSAFSILANAALRQSPSQATTPNNTVAHASEDAPRTLKLIDLRDLLKSDAESTTFGVYTIGGRSAPPPTPDEEKGHWLTSAAPRPGPVDPELEAKRANAWQDMLAHWIQPSLLAQDTLQVTRDGTLIANLTAESHAWLERFLVLQREPKSMLDLEVDFITGPRGAFDRYVEKGTRVISSEDAKQLLADSKPGGAMKRVSSPLFGWVRAWNHASSLMRSSYVKDWTIATVEPGHRAIAVPTIGTVEDGPSVDLRAVPLDATHVGLELDATQSTVKQPIATTKAKLDIDGGREVEVALPEVTKIALKGQVSLEYGGYALFTGMSNDQGSVAVLVHVDRRSDTSPPVFHETIMAVPRKKGSTPDKH
jgi:hypothetical protein